MSVEYLHYTVYIILSSFFGLGAKQTGTNVLTDCSFAEDVTSMDDIGMI